MIHTIYQTYGDNEFVLEYDDANQELGEVFLKHYNAEIPFDVEGLYISKGISLLHYLECKAAEEVANELPIVGPDPHP